MQSKKRIIFDMGLNIVAVAIPTLFLQLIILPSLAGHMSDSNYGLLVTLLAMLNVLPATLGNVLNNIRLLQNNRYEEKGLEGDFNLLLLIMAIIDLLFVGIFTVSYTSNLTIIDVILIILVSLEWIAKEYYIVAFRLKINYIAIFINNILQVIGYAIGYFVFLKTGKWQVIYLLGFFVSLVYIFLHCDLWKERPIKTPLFNETTWQSLLLFFASALNRVITYADKILIYPLLGGAVVSVYYAATVFGKVVALAISPVNSVALTYLAKVQKRSSNVFMTALLAGGCTCVIGYLACIIISRPVLTLLYPQFVDQAMQYIYITTGTTVVYALVTIVDPFILKFFDMKWQIALNGGTAVVYVLLCLTLLHFWGLMGFCVGALLTNVFKFVFMLFIYAKCREKKTSV